MDNLKMVETLKNASLFDLYRLRVLISKILEDPIRLDEIRMRLKVNQEVYYFEDISNREIKALVVNIGRSHVSVKNLDDGKGWRLPIYMINIGESKESSIKPSNKVDRLTIKTGERVGFVTKEGTTLYGIVQKLNPSTATVVVSGGSK